MSENEQVVTPRAPEDNVPFFPRMALREFSVLLLAAGMVVALAVLIPIGYEDKADTLITPAGVKAEWYFLWLYQIMKLVPVLIGIFIPMVIGAAFVFLPWIDRKAARPLRERAGVLTAGFLVLFGIIVLTVWAVLPGGE